MCEYLLVCKYSVHTERTYEYRFQHVLNLKDTSALLQIVSAVLAIMSIDFD